MHVPRAGVRRAARSIEARVRGRSRGVSSGIRFGIAAMLCVLGPAAGHTQQRVPAGPTLTQQLAPRDLAGALTRGGFVLVMRHASAPRELPEPGTANPDNVDRERQLDAAGRAGATAMGAALRALPVPLGEVLTSPAYRARETVRYLGVNAVPAAELGDNGQSMAGVTEAQAAWLRARVAQAPAAGRNTLLVTHNPNLSRAFPEWGPSVADGETVVLRPDGAGRAAIAGRLGIGAWPGLVATRAASPVR